MENMLKTKEERRIIREELNKKSNERLLKRLKEKQDSWAGKGMTFSEYLGYRNEHPE